MGKAIVWKKGTELRDDRGIYRYDDLEYVSVTKALGMHGDMTQVHKWAVKELVNTLAQEVQDGIAHQRWVEVPGGWEWRSTNPLDTLKDGRYISEAGARYIKACADRGTVLHSIVEDYSVGARWDGHTQWDILDYVKEKVYHHQGSCDPAKLINQAINLMDWLAITNPLIVASEFPVFNKKYGYAGTVDLLVQIGKHLWIIDLKTGGDSVTFKRLYSAQCGAYKAAEFMLMCATSGRVEAQLSMPPSKVGILLLDDKRCGLREVDNANQAFRELFLPSLKACRAAESLPLPKAQANWIVKRSTSTPVAQSALSA